MRGSYVSLVCGVTLFVGSTVHSAERLTFNRDIRPILAENCLSCHGPDGQQRKADLRLDQRESAVDGGAIVPGKPEASEFVRRILLTSGDEMMPPATSHKKLTPAQRETLRRWVAEGAQFENHWAFIPPTRPTPPEVKRGDWVRTPIDRFILAELERRGLSPAPEADRSTLIRRLSLDLTGLPPTPELHAEVQADTSPQWYEKLVDRLLDSHAWGEHRARYWLDAARYGDTHGIHFDNQRDMWSYRDWVINAFNRNLPFDQFTIEQLAGDLLPERSLEQQIASGFNRCNITTNEGGAIAEEYLVLYTRDRTETTSQVWLGLTAGCAVCHDHKFDPLTQQEFYSLAAFFNNTTQGAMDGNIKDTPPTIVVPAPEDKPRWTALTAELAKLRGELSTRQGKARPEFDAWLKGATPAVVERTLADDTLHLHVPLTEETAAPRGALAGSDVPLSGAASAWSDGRIGPRAWKIEKEPLSLPLAGNFERDQAFSVGAWIKPPKEPQTGAIVAHSDPAQQNRGWELWIEQGRLVGQLNGGSPQDLLKVAALDRLKLDDWNHVVATYDGSGKTDGLKLYVNGVLQGRRPTANVDALKSSIRHDGPLTIGGRPKGNVLNGSLVQEVRVFRRSLSARDVVKLQLGTRAAHLVRQPVEKRAKPDVDEAYRWWLEALDRDYDRVADQVEVLQREEETLKGRGTIAHVMQEKPAEAMAHVLYRGEYDQRRDSVKPATPSVLPPMPAELPRNRLGLAQWLLRADHPLTARVTVNRHWQELFGTGLVRTAGDFGASGEVPSHPELLDWLAVELREGQWDIKRFFKLLVTSATYRQAAVTTREKQELDPANRLLSRGPRFRMDAEMIRDYALASSGLLVRKIGGPSVKPYQPDGVWEAVAMIGSNTRNYERDQGENLYRRSLYTFWKRSAPPASMEVFNAPNRETCVVRRERTNTPLQALVTLNDPQFVEAARHAAQRAWKGGGSTDAGRLGDLAQRILARPLRETEEQVLLASLADLRRHYAAHPDDAAALIRFGDSTPDASIPAAELAAWTLLANELLNLDEVLNK